MRPVKNKRRIDPRYFLNETAGDLSTLLRDSALQNAARSLGLVSDGAALVKDLLAEFLEDSDFEDDEPFVHGQILDALVRAGFEFQEEEARTLVTALFQNLQAAL